jgi:lipid II:glycine glycyltransferase (peptidoglycan interpeptide bridge formation enzyme)
LVSSAPIEKSSEKFSTLGFDISIGSSLEDREWDQFLNSSPLGQFQQSSMWALTKHAEGWRPIRAIIRKEGKILGGFQILCRQKKVGTIAYVSKGPVVSPETPDMSQAVVRVLLEVVKKRRILALIVQAPENSESVASQLDCAPFVRNLIVRINEATLRVDLSEGIDTTFEGFSASTRKKIRRAQRRGVLVREGSRDDVPTFFELMKQTCQRQGTQPNPHDVKGAMALFDAFASAGCIRLTFAECDGKTIAGLLSIPFGRSLTLWKKGSDSSDHSRHPNELLTMEAFDWGCKHGYEYADFGSLQKSIARALQAGTELTPEQMQTRDFFNIGFGGHPKLMPESRLFIPNRILRLFYSFISVTPLRRAGCIGIGG